MVNKKVMLISLSFCFFFCKAAAAETAYTVLEGDTFWKIALKFNTNLNSLIRSNPQIQNPNIIFPGEEVIITKENTIESGDFLTEKKRHLLELTNTKRRQKGLEPLVLDSSLMDVAQQKSLDMLKNEYVSHNSPTYGNPTIMLKKRQIPFQMVKENIGAGHNSADEMFSAWMNSSIHRDNLLNANVTHIGIGYAEGGEHGHYWTIFMIKR